MIARGSVAIDRADTWAHVAASLFILRIAAAVVGLLTVLLLPASAHAWIPNDPGTKNVARGLAAGPVELPAGHRRRRAARVGQHVQGRPPGREGREGRGARLGRRVRELRELQAVARTSNRSASPRAMTSARARAPTGTRARAPTRTRTTTSATDARHEHDRRDPEQRHRRDRPRLRRRRSSRSRSSTATATATRCRSPRACATPPTTARR